MKKSRKRLLISSVAMLLVAMLALGTATFAWFTTSTNPTADQINVKSTKASTLLVSGNQKNWVSAHHYGVSSAHTMFPASSADGTKWWGGNATDSDGTIDASTLAEHTPDGFGITDWVFKDELNIKNDGTGTVSNITITIKDVTETNPYFCVALVSRADANDTNVKTGTGTFGTIPAAYTAGTDKSAFGGIYQTTAGTYKPIKNDGSVPGASDASITTVANTTINVPDLGAQEMAYYDLYVWFEGQDSDCKNANSGHAIPDLNFEIEGTVDNN